MINHSKKHYYIGWLMAFIAVSLFSTKAVVVKLIYKFDDVDAITTVALRMIMAFPIFAITSYYTWKPLTKKQITKVLLAGFLGYYLASFLDFLCLQYITSSLERLILFLNPGVVLILSRLLFKHSINRWQFASLVMGYISIGIVFGHEQLGGSNIVLGVTLAFLSVISYALYLILCSAVVKEMGAIRLTSLATCVACFLCVAQLFILKSDVAIYLNSMSWKFYALSLVNAIVCTVIPVFLTMVAIERCGATITSQTGIIGPMITIGLGVWLLDEKFTIYHIIGTIGVVLSMILLTKGINKNLQQISQNISKNE